jgi:hypothetical protein
VFVPDKFFQVIRFMLPSTASSLPTMSGI